MSKAISWKDWTDTNPNCKDCQEYWLKEGGTFYHLDWICFKNDFVLQNQGAVSSHCECPSWSFLQEWGGIDEIASQYWLVRITCSGRFSIMSGPYYVSKSCMCMWHEPSKWKNGLNTCASPAHGNISSSQRHLFSIAVLLNLCLIDNGMEKL